MSGGGAPSGVKGGQFVALTGQLIIGRDVDGGLGGGSDIGGGGYGRGDDGDKINMWEDTVAKVILGT